MRNGFIKENLLCKGMKKPIILLIALVISISFLSGCNEQQKTNENENGNTESPPETYFIPPEISLITSASEVITFGEYTTKDTFIVDDIIYIYYEYHNVNHDDIVDTYHTISVYHLSSWVDYYNNYYDGREISDSDEWCKWWEIDTHDCPSGRYQVNVGLQDEISKKTTTKTIYFTLESSPNGGELVGYSRNNPAPIGSSLTFEEEDDWSYDDYKVKVTLVEIIRGSQAWTLIEDANMFNDPPHPGNEYILAKIRFGFLECSDPDTQYGLSQFVFDAVSDEGKDYDNPSIVTPVPRLSADLYAGASHEGWGAFEVEITDNKPLLTFGRDYQGKGGIWFKLYYD